MRAGRTTWRSADTVVEQLVGRVLQVGVLLAAVVAAAGAVVRLTRGAGAVVDYGVFRGEPVGLRSVSGIVHGALALRAESIIALGLLCLIATPIARVVLLVGAFAVQRDRLYVAITTTVLAILVVSLVVGLEG